MLPHQGPSQGGPLGTARWADPEYIAGRYPWREGAIWLGRCPHDPERAIGYEDNRHVFLCAETRSGKGRAFLVNNQVLWPGSLIAIDPKGEAAAVAAARRGPGNAYCDGLGQEVYILDPSGIDLPAELDRFRAHFNPLAALRADDPKLIEKTNRVGKALCEVHEGESQIWDERGRRLVTAVIRHVITAPARDIEAFGLARDLLTVRRLIMEGHRGIAGRIDAKRIAEAKAAGQEPILASPMDLLLRQMAANPACGGEIALAANDALEYRRGHPEGFNSVRNAAVTQLAFLEGQGIRTTVTATGANDDLSGNPTANPRTFRVEDLKDSRISVFLCVQRRDYAALKPWLRAMIEVLIDGMMEREGLGKSGERVLFCIDEFANLGPMEGIEQAVNDIAGAGVKLMLAVQRLGDLKKHYGETWENFIGAAGTQIWFGASSDDTAKYLEGALGQTQVTLYSRGVNVSDSTATSEAVTESYSHTHSLSTGTGTSKTTGETESQTHSTGKTSTYGSSDGKRAGRNYGPHLFFEPFAHATSYDTNSGTHRSQAENEQQSDQRGTSRGTTESENRTTADADMEGGATTKTEQTSQTRGADVREEFHVRPLLSADEARRYLRPMEDNPNDPIEIQEDIREHPAYPGLALIRLATEPDPFFVRKANYDQDPAFVRKFSPNPAFGRFIPLDEQPLFGWQITPEHFFTVSFPADLKNVCYAFGFDGVSRRLRMSLPQAVKPKQWLRRGDVLINVDYDNSELQEAGGIRAPSDVKIIGYRFQEESELSPEPEANAVPRFAFEVTRAIQSAESAIPGGQNMGEVIQLHLCADTPVRQDAIEKELWAPIMQRLCDEFDRSIAAQVARTLHELRDLPDRIVSCERNLAENSAAIERESRALTAEDVRIGKLSRSFSVVDFHSKCRDQAFVPCSAVGNGLAVFLRLFGKRILHESRLSALSQCQHSRNQIAEQLQELKLQQEQFSQELAECRSKLHQLEPLAGLLQQGCCNFAFLWGLWPMFRPGFFRHNNESFRLSKESGFLNHKQLRARERIDFKSDSVYLEICEFADFESDSDYLETSEGVYRLPTARTVLDRELQEWMPFLPGFCRDAQQRLDAARLRVERLAAKEHALNRSLDEARQELGETEAQVTETKQRFEVAAKAVSITDNLWRFLEILSGFEDKDFRERECGRDSGVCFGLFHVLPMLIIFWIFLSILFPEKLYPILHPAMLSMGPHWYGSLNPESVWSPISFFSVLILYALMCIIPGLSAFALKGVDDSAGFAADFAKGMGGVLIVTLVFFRNGILIIWYPIKVLALLLAAPFYPERIWFRSAESERKLTSDALYYSLEPRIKALPSEIANLEESIRTVQLAAKRERAIAQEIEAAVARWCDAPTRK